MTFREMLANATLHELHQLEATAKSLQLNHATNLIRLQINERAIGIVKTLEQML